MARPSNPILFYARLLYLALIVGTIGAMALHNGLDFAMKLRRQMARYAGAVRAAAAPLRAADAGAQGTGWHLRMTLSERIQHGLLAASFFTLVCSGFALKFPEAWPFAWLARIERGYAWRSLIHRAAALLMLATVVTHVVYLFTTRGRGTIAALSVGFQNHGTPVFQNHSPPGSPTA